LSKVHNKYGVYLFFSPFFVNIARKYKKMDVEKYAKELRAKDAVSSIELVQPNKVTNARYNYTEREENILTLMIDAIQKHMTKELPIQTDLFGEPMIVIDTVELGSNNKSQYLEAARNMMNKVFEFEYTNPKTQRKEDVMGVLVTTIRNINGTSKIELTINKWAIPYLLYWGKGVGGTIFSKAIALKLPGSYTKRLYKLCKRWEDTGYFSMPLDELREMLVLESKYPKIKDLKKWVLEPAKERMKKMADMYFSYSLEKVAGSRSYNFIHFNIHANDRNRATGKKSDMYVFIYSMLSIAYPVVKSSKARDIADHLSQNPDEFERLYFRLKKLKNELDTGEKDVKDVIRLIKHIIKTDYGIS